MTTQVKQTTTKPKRKPIKNVEEYDKYPIITLNRSAHNYREGSLFMRDGDFERFLLPKLMIIHEEAIGWNRSEDEEYNRSSERIEAIIYGSHGTRTSTGQDTVYYFYVRYDQLLWSTNCVLEAIKIIESIRCGELLRQKKNREREKRWNERRKKLNKLKVA
jgi:hypothetical protein